MRTLMFRRLVLKEISLFKISSSESNSDLSYISDDDSEYNYIPDIYLDFETEKAETTDSERDVDDLNGYRAYTDEPLGDEEWLKEYERSSKLKKKKKKKKEATRRLN